MADSEVVGEAGEVSFVLEIKRASTGIVETYNCVGTVIAAPDTNSQPEEAKE